MAAFKRNKTKAWKIAHMKGIKSKNETRRYISINQIMEHKSALQWDIRAFKKGEGLYQIYGHIRYAYIEI